MSPEKPKTPPERVETFNAVYEIIPDSEDFPETETAFGGPHYTRNGPGSMGFAFGAFYRVYARPRLHHRRGSRGVELPFYCSFDVSLVKS